MAMDIKLRVFLLRGLFNPNKTTMVIKSNPETSLKLKEEAPGLWLLVAHSILTQLPYPWDLSANQTFF
jgi:hypothetical protein